MKKIPVVLILSLLIGLSCKKDNEEIISESELLTQMIWVHSNEMVDLNNNLKPDDEHGSQKDIIFNFKDDGTLEYSQDQNVKQLEWEFESNETVIKIIGIMDDSFIPPIEESTHNVYLLDENTLILFYASTIYNPDIGTFEIYKHN